MAQTEPDRATLLQRLEQTLSRVEQLERRIQELERSQTMAGARRRDSVAAPRQATEPMATTARTRTAAEPPAVITAARPTPATEPPASSTRATPAARPPPAPAALPVASDGTTSRARDPRDEDIPQEAFVFRDQAVTLRPGRAEVSLDLNYSRDRRNIVSDRNVFGTVTGRLGVMDGVEASLTLPYFASVRSFETGNGIQDREARNIGDLTFQVNTRLWGERPNWPGAIFTAAVIAPTGPSPFAVSPEGLGPTIVPVDVTQLISARGAWALRAGVQFFKTVDPLVLFGGIAYENVFPVHAYGVTFRPGNRAGYNAGLSFALSERSTLGLTFIGTYTSAMEANQYRYRNSATETGVLRFSLVQRVLESAWIEPSMSIGLVSEAPNFQAGLGLRYRF